MPRKALRDANLKRWLYWMHRAAREREKECQSKFKSIGYDIGSSGPTVMRKDSKQVQKQFVRVVRGRDLISMSAESE